MQKWIIFLLWIIPRLAAAGEADLVLQRQIAEHNAGNGYFPTESAIRNPQIAWKITLTPQTEFIKLGFVARPVVVNGVLYAVASHRYSKVASAHSTIYAVDVKDGRLIWSTELPATELSSGEIAFNGELLFVSTHRGVRAVRLRDGMLAWKWEVEAGQWMLSISSPLCTDGKVFVALEESGKVQALDATTGKEVWAAAFEGTRKIPYLAAHNETLLFHSSVDDFKKHDLFALNLSSGKRRWREMQEPFWMDDCAVHDGVLYCGGKIARAISIDAGKVLWELQIGDGPVSKPVIANEKVYFTGEKNRRQELFSVEAKTGRILWSKPNERGAFLTVIGDAVLSTQYQTIHAFDAKDGTRIFDFTPDEKDILCPPTFSDGRLFLGTSQGAMYCITSK